MDEFSNRVCFTIDDGSGATIEATCLAPPRPDVPLDGTESGTAAAAGAALVISRAPDDQMVSPDGPKLKGVDVGAVVKVKGGISVFRGVRQVAMKAVAILGDTNAEVNAWREGVRFRKEVLKNPWVVTKEEEQRCREEAEGEKWRVEEEERRKRRREMRAKKEEERHGGERKKEKRSRLEKEAMQAVVGKEGNSTKSRILSEKEKNAREEREKARRARAIQRLVQSRPKDAGKYAALGL